MAHVVHRPVDRLDGTDSLRRLRERFDDDWAWLSSLCPVHPCRGGLRFFNTASRGSSPPQSLVLFDPVPRVAPWPYEAANCHTLTNYESVVPGGRPLVSLAAGLRHDRGLETPDEEDVLRISTLFCAWLAVMWRAMFRELQTESERGHGDVRRPGGAMRALVVLLVMLTACGPEPRRTISNTPGTATYAASGTVLESADAGPKLCLGFVRTSRPPQCGDIPITNWSWDEASGEQSAGGTTWGDYDVVGTYDGTTFTITQPPQPATPRTPAPSAVFGTPCPEPRGGWPAGGREQDVGPARRVARDSEHFSGLWLDRPVGGPAFILNAAFTADLDRHERELREVWEGPLCVSRHERTYAELERVQRDLFPGGAKALGLRVLSASSSEVRNVVEVQVILATDADRRAVDERYGKGVVELASALRPAD